MMKRIWLLPIAVVAVWQGPARLVRWMMDRPAQACDRGCPLAGHDRRDHEATAELDRTQALRPGATCDLDNISGDIEVRPAAGGTAHLHATLTARDRSPDAARQALQHVRVEWHGDERGLSARAVYDPG